MDEELKNDSFPDEVEIDLDELEAEVKTEVEAGKSVSLQSVPDFDAPKAESAPAGAATQEAAPGKGSILFDIIAGLVCTAIGIAIGHFLLGGTGSAGRSLAGVTSLSEEQLNSTVVGSYTVGGKTTEFSAADVIGATTGLESAKMADGSYTLPSADDALAYVRNTILNEQVAKEGITVSDEELNAFAEEQMGSSDFASIAASWGIDETEARRIAKESCAVYKLRNQIVGEVEVAKMPEAPEAPEDGDSERATEGYATYILNLLGDEWDSEKNTWARKDGPYYQALDGNFDGSQASYGQAEAAYFAAYQVYAEGYTSATAAWTSYVNNLMSGVSINIYTLVS